MIRTLDRYIWREMMPTLVEATMLCTFIFFLQLLFEFTRKMVETWSTFWMGFSLFAAVLPSFCSMSIPVAFLLTTLLVYGRLAEEREITAMMAGGISLLRIMRPVLLLGALLTVILLYWSHIVGPLSQRYFFTTVGKIMEQSIAAGIQPERFQDIGGQFTLVAGEIDHQAKIMRNIQIFEIPNPRDKNYIGFVVGAKQAEFDLNHEKMLLNLDMHDGCWWIVESSLSDGLKPNENTRQVYENIVNRFSRMNWSLDVSRLIVKKARQDKSATQLPGELQATIHTIQDRIATLNQRIDEQKSEKKSTVHLEAELRPQIKALYEFQKERAARVADPFAVIVMGAVAAPLGVMMRRGRKGASVGVTIVMVLIYYLLQSVGEAMAENGNLPATFAMWIPNLVTLAIAFICFRKATQV